MKKTTCVLLLAAFGCGGGQKQTEDSIGQSTADPHRETGSDLDVEDAGAKRPVEPPVERRLPPSGIIFVMNNTHSDELVFNTDRGWGANILAFSGKPPKAVSIIPFAKYCTSACDASAEELCPFCPEPEKLKDIRESQHLEHIAAGASLEVPWDGKVRVYEKTRGVRDGKKRRCECYRVQDAVAGTYQVRACGLRLTKSAKERSQLQCVDATMALPAQGQRIEFRFDAPKPPKKAKGK
jgi:hypothetical protein